MSILREILRNFRRNLLFIGGGWGIAEGCALAAGTSPVPGDLAGIALGAAASVLAYRSVHEPLLRRIAHRPRKTMTRDDYKRLRELEAELGWEPSEAPAPGTGIPAAARAAAVTGGGGDGEYTTPARRVALSPVETEAERERYRETRAAGHFAALSGSGFLSAHACDCGSTSSIAEVHVPESASPVAFYCACCGKRTRDDVAHVPARTPAADEHFAALARVGREYCPSYCHICARRLLGSMHYEEGPVAYEAALQRMESAMRTSILALRPDLGNSLADLKRDMRDLSDLDGMRARIRPFVTSDLAPVGAHDLHLDSAGREWCRDGDGLCWLKFAPDGPWHRQDKPGEAEQR